MEEILILHNAYMIWEFFLTYFIFINLNKYPYFNLINSYFIHRSILIIVWVYNLICK
jgi:hypothetical protein